jgi:hypothetical protein
VSDDDEDENLEASDGSVPAIDPKDLKSSKGWLALIKQAETTFQPWQDKATVIDKLYANLEVLGSTSREREFQLFWANIQVLGPSIYSRPPIPVIVPEFKDQRPLPRTASEMLERSTVVTFKTQDIDAVMRLLRDDLNIVGRGAAWIRYEAAKKGDDLGQRVCIEHKDRKDFLHDPATKWADVDWVASASYLTRSEMRKRFLSTSGDAYKSATYAVRKNEITGEIERKLKAKVWEIWCRSKNRVYWVCEGADVFLDESAPHLTLEGFFPCPKPAYATVQRGSLIPVPDMLFYKDQLEEIDEYTARISALSEALRLKGFYPGGAGELSDAIEAAMKRQDDNAILVPISNWAMIGSGSGGAKDMILWIPIDMVATTITELVALRKQVIEDVYQIMGLSDIMRGQTEASETLGAQQLKSQYGSVRIRDKQQELVRIALEITRITAEIMAENFTGKSMLDMSQMEIPSNADIAKQIAPIEAQLKQIVVGVKQAAKDPRTVAMAKAQPDQAKQMIDQAQQQAQGLQKQLATLVQTLTVEDVMKFLRDNRTRVFQLDIETDSTITPDENAQKQRATEYVTAMSGLFGQLIPAIEQLPQAAPLAAEVIKWVNSQFRVGREFAGAIDTFTEQMQQIAAQPKNTGPTAEQIKQQSEQMKGQLAGKQQEMDSAVAAADAKLAQKDLELRQATAAADAKNAADKIASDERVAMAKNDATTANEKLKAITSIVVAHINNAMESDGITLEAQLSSELGLQEHRQQLQQAEQDHAHALELQANEQQHAVATQAADQQHQQGMQADQNDASMQQQEAALAAQPEPSNGPSS